MIMYQRHTIRIKHIISLWLIMLAMLYLLHELFIQSKGNKIEASQGGVGRGTNLIVCVCQSVILQVSQCSTLKIN